MCSVEENGTQEPKHDSQPLSVFCFLCCYPEEYRYFASPLCHVWSGKKMGPKKQRKIKIYLLIYFSPLVECNLIIFTGCSLVDINSNVLN